MIAVSGASGFLGSYVVCMLLEKGQSVRAFRREQSCMQEFEQIFQYYFQYKSVAERSALQSNIHWILADINDIPSIDIALTDVTEVYHCAAIVSFEKRDREKLFTVNIEGTTNMVNMALTKGVQKFCYVSSIAALGRSKTGDFISEQTKWTSSKNNSNYAISKYKAELEVWRAAEEGLNVCIVNPGVILGVGNWNKGSCKLFQLVWKGMPFYTEGINGYVDVKDVAKAMLLVTEQSVFNQRFVLVGGNISMRYFLDTVSTFFGKKKPTIKVTKWIAQLAWIVDGIRSKLMGKRPSLTRETAHASMNVFYYSSKKIEEQLNFVFTPIEQTLKETCTQFNKN